MAASSRSSDVHEEKKSENSKKQSNAPQNRKSNRKLIKTSKVGAYDAVKQKKKLRREEEEVEKYTQEKKMKLRNKGNF
ncbi:hypothetical protein PsorP6_004165 [Peronosclerospora sorghi]|uniref:Uncharacterized protein n=1 Tax=Peronosclerospora sorghi TaxID=230839 RepID=A0ACC0VKX4_9STRA|nr:hypothetical protein PsorP6_004165 [Peronosclerospora sorghi]